jgi:hypothetical protein
VRYAAAAHADDAVPERNGKFEGTPFSELAIGCERCHGPGAAHVQAMLGTNIRKPQNAVMANALGRRIVNPARLRPYLADNISN